MTSIVQTLRDLADCKHSDLSVASEAADEITRLTARVKELEAELADFRRFVWEQFGYEDAE